MTKTPTPVILAPGTLPPAWEQPGIFVANLLSLFFGNDEQTADLSREVGRLETYGGRLLPILGLLYRGDHPNTVVLEGEPDDTLLDYFTATLGLKVPTIRVLPHRDYLRLAREPDPPAAAAELIAALRATPDGMLDGFVTDRALLALARHTGLGTLNHPDGSYAGNNKLLLHEHLVAQNLPAFTTHLATDLDEVRHALRELARAGYGRAAIKSQIGASGIGIWQCRTDTTQPELPAYAFFDRPCLVQGWIETAGADISAVHSPSAQLLVHEEAVHVYDLTDQILSDDSVHQGNMAPPHWLEADKTAHGELLRQASIVGRWLHERGYRGTASIDFHVTDRSAGREIRVCEVNARVTGATYPALLARQFAPEGAWLMRNVRFDPPQPPATVLAAVRDAGLLFHPGDRSNLLPINLNTDDAGLVTKGQFLCLAPDLSGAGALLDELRTLLPVTGDYDRD